MQSTTLLKEHTISENNESKETHVQAKSSKATNLIATPPNTRINLNCASKKGDKRSYYPHLYLYICTQHILIDFKLLDHFGLHS